MINVEKLSTEKGPLWFTDTSGEALLREWRRENTAFTKELSRLSNSFSIYAGDFDDPYTPKLVYAGGATLIAKTIDRDQVSDDDDDDLLKPRTPSGYLSQSRSLSIGYYESIENLEPQFHAVSADIFFEGLGFYRLDYVRLIIPFQIAPDTFMPVMYTRPLHSARVVSPHYGIQ